MNDCVVQTLKSFLTDEAGDDFQAGYLAAMLDIYYEVQLTGLTQEEICKLEDMI